MRFSRSISSLLLTLLVPAAAVAQATPADPRVGLKTGWHDAGEASSNMRLVSHSPKPAGFFNPQSMGDFSFLNADFAISGNRLVVGGFHGLQFWDIGNPVKPVLTSTLVCPGGQGDVSIHRNLLFMSVEEGRGRVDCGAQGVRDTASAERFMGVRIFDITVPAQPRQVASVQTCRGSHTHTLVTDPRDPAHVYIYVGGTAPVRSASELAGCSGRGPEDPNSSYFRIEVIKVPLAAPSEARVVNAPRVFADTAGNIAGLWPGGRHGPNTQETATTDQCHDLTAYTAMGLMAGACSGNGILLDISDPANPKRIAEVSDPNFAYWHSATFSNDGSKVIYTDEWGGGVAPRCLASDRPEWGANAIFEREGRTLRFASYYKLPAPQTRFENCVAHNGNLIPVPGRDIMVQAWYQGGVSVFDFTDAANPVEIAYFDRGPMDTTLVLSGFWSAYWHNGYIYATEIGRGLDILELRPSPFLSENEIAAARLVRADVLNAQNQQRIVWPASFVVARAYLDGLVRRDGLRRQWAAPVYDALLRAERQSGSQRRATLAPVITQLVADAARTPDGARLRELAEVVRGLTR